MYRWSGSVFYLKQDLQTDGFIKRADFIYAWTGCPDTVKGIRYLAKTVWATDGVLHSVKENKGGIGRCFGTGGKSRWINI